MISLLTMFVGSGVAAVAGPVVTHYLRERSGPERLDLTCEELRAGWLLPGESGWQEPVEGLCEPVPMRLRCRVDISNRGKQSAILRDLDWSVRDRFGEGFHYGFLGPGHCITLERIGDRLVGKPAGPGQELEAFKIEPGEYARLLYDDNFVVFDVVEGEQRPDGPAPRPCFTTAESKTTLKAGKSR